MSLTSGTKLGPYEIQTPLGAGGMGEVYRARDTRLGRDVAVKILPESFASDSERLHRFEQEARAVAVLSHPNILAIFDTGQNNGSPYLVSELLEGETLRTVLDRGAISSRKAIEFAVQIAQGLAAAHEKGIVHRDLKPENVFVTRDGRIKILDFGLAKQSQKATATSTDGVTLTSSHTAAGLVMGTASYMAPEQVRGEPADPRTDIFAFGAVLYEMLSGKKAFRRDTSAETMTAILREDPPELVDHPISPSLERIVRRCLEKQPEQRFQSAKDLSFALSALSGTDSTGAARVAAVSHKYPLWLWLALGFAAVVAIGVTTAWFAFSHGAQPRRMQFAIPVSGEVSHMALSPDGSTLVFVSPDENSAIPTMFLQKVGSNEVRELTGTEDASYPFWSPDGAYIAFFAKGELQKVAVIGGTPQVLAKVWAARGGSWGSRNVILYAPDSGTPIWRINSDGSGAAAVTDLIYSNGDQTHRWPIFLPDGNHFLFFAGNFASGTPDDRSSGIYLSSLDKKEKKLVVLQHSSFAISSDHVFYADESGHLMGAAFDSRGGKLNNSPTVVANVVGFQPSTYWAALTAAANGTLVFNVAAGGALSQLTWMDRSGKELGQVGEPAVQCNPALAPDGSRIALDISDLKGNNVDIWVESSSGEHQVSRFTFDPAEEVVGKWSRDGKTIAYRSAGGTTGRGTLFVKAANGLEHERAIAKIKDTDDIIPNSWSSDDKKILCTHQSPAGYHLEIVSVADGSATPFEKGPGNQTNGMISPDGKWVAYASDESGTWEIYVTTFPGAAGKWQVSRGGGAEPHWRGDGKEIFYIGPSGMLTAIPVSTEGTFSTGTPTPLFQFHGRASISSTDVFSYDATSDGKRFLINRYVKPEHVTPLTIVLNASAN